MRWPQWTNAFQLAWLREHKGQHTGLTWLLCTLIQKIQLAEEREIRR